MMIISQTASSSSSFCLFAFLSALLSLARSLSIYICFVCSPRIAKSFSLGQSHGSLSLSLSLSEYRIFVLCFAFPPHALLPHTHHLVSLSVVDLSIVAPLVQKEHQIVFHLQGTKTKKKSVEREKKRKENIIARLTL